jgi:hypothetical protein
VKELNKASILCCSCDTGKLALISSGVGAVLDAAALRRGFGGVGVTKVKAEELLATGVASAVIVGSSTRRRFDVTASISVLVSGLRFALVFLGNNFNGGIVCAARHAYSSSPYFSHQVH